MKIIKNVLKNDLNIRTEMDFPIKGIEFVDINPLIMQRETLNEIIDVFTNNLKDKNIDISFPLISLTILLSVPR